MRTAHISYGILGGKHSMKPFIQALARQGIQTIAEPHKADVLIAYSAGCFWAPQPHAKQTLILVDPPYWPGRSLPSRAWQRAFSNTHPMQYGYTWQAWASRQLWALYYTPRDILQAWRIIRAARHYDLASVVQQQPVTILRSQYDDWLTPDFADLKQLNEHTVCLTAPGDHDGITYLADDYAEIIQRATV